MNTRTHPLPVPWPEQARRHLLVLAGSALAGLWACQSQPGPPQTGPRNSLRAVADSGSGPLEEPTPALAFADATVEAGIAFRHESGAFGRKWMPETMGSGCALFDYDSDGAPDLLLVNGNYWPGHEQAGPAPTLRLYRNLGDGRFQDETRSARLDLPLYGMGAAAGDYDADGDLDLYLTAAGDNRLLRNDRGSFVDVTAAAGVGGGRWRSSAGVENPEWSTSAAWVDVDRDGWIDLFVCNYVQWSPETDLFTTIDGVHKSYATPQQYDGSTCRLFRNLGDGRFADITHRAGMDRPSGKSLGVAIADFEDDGYPDLVVANDTQPTFLYRNLADGSFADIALAAGVAYDEAGRARAGMGVDVASLDNDRSLAIGIGNFSRELVSLYHQVRGDVFADEAGIRRVAGPTSASLTFGLLFLDGDLDGYQDLVLANGHIEPTVQTVQQEIAYAQPPQFFWNDRSGGFRDATAAAGEPFRRPVVGRGLAAGDLDGDGDLDLVLTTNGGPAMLLRNETPVGNAVRVRLRGRWPNLEALGAVATATAGDLEQRAMVRTGSSYLSQSETILTFGLGTRPRVDRLSIRWPDGGRETLGRLDAGATYVVAQGEGVVQQIRFRPRRAPEPDLAGRPAGGPTPEIASP